MKDLKLDTGLKGAVMERGFKPPKEVDPDHEYADGSGLGGAVWVREAKLNNVLPGMDGMDATDRHGQVLKVK
ncbi:hypothetical protein K443DRAFT_2134 [Laccaria amethystina LaAM-08-1]|uniref:Uncharacterized protein n=1 Tax=Laccaria amethystina LaAM-08-1 TaxID=1095629 RepID=A0A0C9Y126_9AGAR|nr:hypothetical protein K443DRAFT_2134 [Laccaria amethystina LaAM-08-1]